MPPSSVSNDVSEGGDLFVRVSRAAVGVTKIDSMNATDQHNPVGPMNQGAHGVLFRQVW